MLPKKVLFWDEAMMFGKVTFNMPFVMQPSLWWLAFRLKFSEHWRTLSRPYFATVASTTMHHWTQWIAWFYQPHISWFLSFIFFNHFFVVVLLSFKSLIDQVVMVLAFNPSTREIEVDRSLWVQGQPSSEKEFQGSQSFTGKLYL